MARGVTLKAEWIRSGTSHDIQQVRRLIAKYVRPIGVSPIILMC